jgi:multidrug efflux pump subunit AcrA (membrane-fusion protein)
MKQLQCLVIALALISCSSDETYIFPQERDITESVYASITIQPDSLYQVHSIVAGILEKNLLEEGEEVEKGQAIIQVVNSAPKLNTDNARLGLELAKANYSGSSNLLGSIEDEINSAQLKFENDSINYFRQKKLWNQNIGSKVEYDSRELSYRLSKNSLELLKNKYDRTKNELESAVRQAENSYRASLIGTTDFTIKSKLDGTIYALYKNPGELVNTMEPLAAIGMSDQFIIEMLVDEVDIVKVSVGQNIIVSLDAYYGEVFEATVSKILPKKDERNQTFTVEGSFDQVPNKLYPGLAGEANIVISMKQDVLTIPRSYLVDGNAVRTEDGLVAIETGLQNLEFVEVLSGINKETPILKPKR